VKVSARHGRVQLRLDHAEAALLESLLAELTTVLGDDADDADPVVARLYPDAYADDTEAEADFRSLTHESLRTDRLDRIASCVGDLEHSRDVDLSEPQAAQRWITTLNDLRLALGTRLGVTEDDYAIAPDDEPRLIYHWLTAVQDTVVNALMR
jgi:uncharacterized protein DUF2017